MLRGKQVSGDGRFEFHYEVQQIALLMGKYNYAAKVVRVMERKTDSDVTSKFGQLHEHYGVLTDEAVQNAIAEAEKLTGSKDEEL